MIRAAQVRFEGTRSFPARARSRCGWRPGRRHSASKGRHRHPGQRAHDEAHEQRGGGARPGGIVEGGRVRQRMSSLRWKTRARRLLRDSRGAAS